MTINTIKDNILFKSILGYLLGIYLIIVFQTSAMAAGGLFVEPMLTYESGDATVNFPAPFNSSESSINGLGIGARLGAHLLETVFVAADFRYSFPNYENAKTHIDTDATAYNYGIVAGVQVPAIIGLRLWAGYILGGGMDPDSDQHINVNFRDADGFRIGAGLMLAMVSLNLEYQHMNYAETTVENASVFSGPTNSIQQDNNSIILGVSFPIAL